MKEQSQNSSSAQFLKTDGGKTKSNAIEVPSISLPKGGGAIKGIDEKFSVNAVNGTASFIIPLPFSPARGASPSLSLSYNSGSGNGIFGLGWSLSLPSIKRKSDKGLPRYFDNIDSDIFLFSEAEDLVPVFEKVYENEDDQTGTFQPSTEGKYTTLEKEFTDGTKHYAIRFYKPRIEALFARIERWTQTSGAEAGIIRWRVITKDNVTTLFGWSPNSRIADPADSTGTRIYEWLPEFVFDDKGNCSKYIYKTEDKVGFDYDALHNKNRIKNRDLTYTNLYLKTVLYGNQTPYKKFGDPFPGNADFLFETAFDYGQLKPGDLTHEPDQPDTINTWDLRPDAFSNYKPGFEIRTSRLCKRVLLFHHFAEYNGLVKSVNFEYDISTQRDFTFLKSITAYGYIKKADGSYSQKNLPATEFTYQAHDWNADVKNISTENLVHAPSGLGEPQYQFTDLFNEGLAGILTEQAGGWYYKHNLGNGNFANARLVSPKPNFMGLGNQLHLADLDANGGKQLVNYSVEPKGYFELNDEEEWQPFKNFKTLPNINMDEANTKLVDLNGDGKADVLISGDNVFTWYQSTGKKGFDHIYRTPKSSDEEAGPNVVFADNTQSIFLADMSGDGLSDIVRIRNGEVCYWPNLGYGKFGAKVQMDDAPVFDFPGTFNPALIKLADIDGSGTTDIIYLGKNKFSCWSNLSGNSFNTIPFEIQAFPDIHNDAKIVITDLLGNGVACIVWSSPLAKDRNASLRYIDLMNSKKPHIMIGYKNNMGKEVSMKYKASTQFYIEDKLAGRPWVTKLHFPVHCIARTETSDKISGYLFVSEYKYHHGYYDHAEREFRGFGMVEQTDAENFEAWQVEDATNVTEENLYQPPVISKSWTHTGAFIGSEKILNQFENEYWFEEMKRNGFDLNTEEHHLPAARIIDEKGKDLVAANNLSARDWQEALRACKGMALRSEVFSKEAKAENLNADELRSKLKKELTPYSVATHNCIIQRLQPRGQNRHAIFIVKESEAITYSYERNIEDPRIAHNLNLTFDDIGNVLETVSVVYPRKIINAAIPGATQKAQGTVYITYVENTFTNDIAEDDAYRLRLPAEVKSYQLIYNLNKIIKDHLCFTLNDFENIFNDAAEVGYETDTIPSGENPQKRLIEHIRTTYRSNMNLNAALPLYKAESLALPFESYQLAYSPDLLNDIYHQKVSGAGLAGLMTDGKFVHSEGDLKWWIQSGQMNFIDTGETAADAQARFYLPVSYSDPYGSVTKVEYETHKLFVKKTQDKLLNESSVTKFNYRTLSPQQMKDINDNLSEAITDELGLVKAIAVMGKDFNHDGIGDEADDLDLLTDETTDQTAINEFFVIANAAGVCNSNYLHSKAKDLLGHATERFVYDLDEYLKNGKPAVVASIAREQHFKDNPQSPVQLSFEYSNGPGKVIMKKVQAEPDTSVSPYLRWIGNGRTILNNKGNPVKQYEPYFSFSPKFDDEKEMVETGVTPIMYYDAMSRLIKTEMPDGTFSKVEFDSWRQIIFDANDTVTDSDWYKKRTDHTRTDYIGDAGEQAAVAKAVTHYNTPSQLHFDTLGRPVLQIENNSTNPDRDNHLYETKIELDIEGNLRSVTDAREMIENHNLGNLVMEYRYDMLGNKVYQNSMDSGKRWLMINVVGNPLRTWDERDHEFQYHYDDLHRPLYSKVINTVGKQGDKILNNIFDKIIYGENQPDDKIKNLRGKPIRHYDTGGLLQTPAYNFKGQAKYTTRKLFKHYKKVPDWIVDNSMQLDLEAEEFTFTTETDALGRITKQTAPSSDGIGSIITPLYNKAGLLNSESVQLFNPGSTMDCIKDIDYNEKGQRTKVIYGNNITTTYEYDRKNFRLRLLKSFHTSLGNTSKTLQELSYTYDPAGNILRIEDKANEVTFFSNMRIEPVSEFTYDALYRLTSATGRENSTPLDFAGNDNWNDIPKMKLHQPGDPMAVVKYTQSYSYDEVGNIIEMNHLNKWTRTYEYEANSNRLKNTQVGGHTFLYPHHLEHGDITKLPHLNIMGWNFKEELISTSQQVINAANGSTPETTCYQYDGQGQRIRKITENYSPTINTTKKDERIYIAGYETYRTYHANTKNFERESLSLMDKEHRFVMIETVKQNDAPTPAPPERVGLRLTRYQLHNHLGSACLELDETARVISYEEYHPYGTTAYRAKNKTIKCAAKRYRYTGMERDEETGLEYHSARYYLPWLGRWLSADPVGLKSGINLYRAFRANPITFTDTNGKAESNRQLLGLDDKSVDQDLTNDSSLSNVLALTAKQTLYDVWNGLTAGFVAKHDALFEAREKGQISESEYIKGTSIQATKSLAVTVVSGYTGGALGKGATTLLGRLGAASAGGFVGGTAVDFTEQTFEKYGSGEIKEYSISRLLKSGAISAVMAGFSSPAMLAGLKRLGASVGLKSIIKPGDFGLKSISSNPQLAALWDQAVDKILTSASKNGKIRNNALQKLFTKISEGKAVSNKEFRTAFALVRDEFTDLAGISLADLKKEIHHWNWPGRLNASDAINRDKLFITDKATHLQVHEATSSAFWPSKSQVRPIDPSQRM